MTRRVVWSVDALDDMKRQIAYTARDNPDAAGRIAHRLRETGAALGTFATGRPGRVSGTYEKSVPRLPFIIAYSLAEGGAVVSILHVIHTARNWLPNAWPD